MACLHPLKRWIIGYDPTKDQDIAKVTSWDKKFVIDMKGKPIYKFQQIPCGKCIECRLEYSKQWATRCMIEHKNYKNSEGITLTYDDEHVPKKMGIDPSTGEYKKMETLLHRDVQLFMKKLRKKYGNELKVYGCGEYGSENKRPHYHLAIFGLKVDDKELHSFNKKGNKIYTSQIIEDMWGKGFAPLNDITYEMMAYIARYMLKKQKGPNAKEEYEARGQKPEYSIMSRKEGIGKSEFEKLKEGDYEKKKIWLQTKKTLKATKPPRYYDKLYEAFNEEEYKKIKEHRKELQMQREATLLAQTSLNEEEYRKVREANIRARLKNSRIFESGE